MPELVALRGGASGSGSGKYKPPLLPLASVLSEAHRAHLHTSGLTDATIDASRCYTITTRNEFVELLGRTDSLPPRGGAIAIPFMWPGEAQPYAYRVRPDEPRKDRPKGGKGKLKPVKYDQPKREAVGVMLYYPPRTVASGELGDITRTLVVVEGEKKCLALDQLGYTVVGLCGVWNWLDSDARRANRDDWRLHPRLVEHSPIAGRRVVYVADQDVWTNSNVMLAVRRFARCAQDAGALGTTLVTPPDYSEHKGVDDWYAAGGDVAELFASAQHVEPYDDSETAAVPFSRVPALRDAPVPSGLAVPYGYEVGDTGRVVCQGGKQPAEVSPRPMVVATYYSDYVTGEMHADVVYRSSSGAWSSAYVSRRALVDARACTAELGPVGAPVTSVTAKHVVGWFAAYEVANGAVLRPRRSISRTGWLGPDVFMSHETIWSTEADPEVVASGDLTRYTRVLAPRGSLDAHARAVAAAWRASPIARVAVCAALAATLLDRVGMRGFAVHLCGDSSRGKTTMLRVAASVFGDPDDPAWVASWNTTANAAESRAATLCDLPLCYDEAGASDLVAIRRLVYTLANGEGRGRLGRDTSLRTVTSWRTVVLSSGEIPLADSTQATGAQARVLDLIVDGFGELDGDAAAIDALRATCADNAGSLGAEWLGRLVELAEGDWSAIRERRKAIKLAYTGDASSPLKSRVADYVALLAVVEEIVVRFWPSYGFGTAGVVVEALAELGGTIKPAAERIATVLRDAIAARPDSFPIAESTGRGALRVRLGERVERHGLRVATGLGEVVEVLLIPSYLRRVCAENNASYASLLRDWAASGAIRFARNGVGHSVRYDLRRTVEGSAPSTWIVWVGHAADGGDDEQGELSTPPARLDR